MGRNGCCWDRAKLDYPVLFTACLLLPLCYGAVVCWFIPIIFFFLSPFGWHIILPTGFASQVHIPQKACIRKYISSHLNVTKHDRAGCTRALIFGRGNAIQQPVDNGTAGACVFLRRVAHATPVRNNAKEDVAHLLREKKGAGCCAPRRTEGQLHRTRGLQHAR